MENNFNLQKKIEIEINREVLLKYLEGLNESAWDNIGISFIYSKPADLIN